MNIQESKLELRKNLVKEISLLLINDPDFSLHELKNEVIKEIYIYNKGHVYTTARNLGVTNQTIYTMRDHGHFEEL